LIFSQ